MEQRFLAKGITVARTANDLVRYHGKMMLVDRKEVFVLSYNFTHMDIERSRSFGIATKNSELVREACALFDSDVKRVEYKTRSKKFIVSPVNSREQLSTFIKGAKKKLLIYDIKISDRGIIRLLEDRIKTGVEVRILGGACTNRKLPLRKLDRLRLHTRGIVRDDKSLFLGSQSLRKLELDARREIGVIVHGGKIVSAFSPVFEDDWKAAEKKEDMKTSNKQEAAQIKRVANAAVESVPLAAVVEHVMEALREHSETKLQKKAVKKRVKIALKKAVKKAAAELVEKAG